MFSIAMKFPVKGQIIESLKRKLIRMEMGFTIFVTTNKVIEKVESGKYAPKWHSNRYWSVYTVEKEVRQSIDFHGQLNTELIKSLIQAGAVFGEKVMKMFDKSLMGLVKLFRKWGKGSKVGR